MLVRTGRRDVLGRALCRPRAASPGPQLVCRGAASWEAGRCRSTLIAAGASCFSCFLTLLLCKYSMFQEPWAPPAPNTGVSTPHRHAPSCRIHWLPWHPSCPHPRPHPHSRHIHPTAKGCSEWAPAPSQEGQVSEGPLKTHIKMFETRS